MSCDVTPAELANRARQILGGTPSTRDDSPSAREEMDRYGRQVTQATLAVLIAGEGRWAEAQAMLREIADAELVSDRRAAWLELAREAGKAALRTF